MKSIAIITYILLLPTLGCSSDLESSPHQTERELYHTILLGDSAKRRYIIDHYWDNYSFYDTLYTNNTHHAETTINRYISLLCSLTEPEQIASIDMLLDSIVVIDKRGSKNLIQELTKRVTIHSNRLAHDKITAIITARTSQTELPLR